MKLYFRLLYVSILATTLTIKAYSQDLHLSQFDAAPLFYNPALSGNFDGVHRFIFNGKSQWNTYNTALLSYDCMLPSNITLADGKFGIGGIVTEDKSGTLGYGYTILHLMPSYHVSIIPNDILFLSAGLDISYTHVGYDLNKGITDYDPANGNPVNNLVGQTSTGYMDVAAGINAYSLIDGVYPVNLGFTLAHLLEPGKSMTNTSLKINTPRRININANSIYSITNKIVLLPSFIWLHQSTSNEINFGTYVKYIFPTNPYAAYIGGWWRVGDAAILGIAFDIPGFQSNHVVNVGLSYDITLGQFANSAKWDKSIAGSNSFEISIKYIIKKGLFRYTPPTKLNPINF